MSTDEESRGEVVDAVRDIESKPLAERAHGYQTLADQLRSDLEHSDPSRTPN